MSQIEHAIRMTDAEVNRYMRAKLRELQCPEKAPDKEPEMSSEKAPEKGSKKKITWASKIDQKEMEQKPV